MAARSGHGTARVSVWCYDPLLFWFWGWHSMHIAAVGWIYVTLMMAITEETVVAGIMTFFFYGVLPTLIILYVSGSGQRRRRREQETRDKLAAMQARQAAKPASDARPESGQAADPATSVRANPDQ